MLMVFSFVFTSCKKEEGCVDSSAMNYNVDADKDDGTCVYSHQMAQGIWNIIPDCEDITIPILGETISLNDQLPETIEIQGSTDNTLFIDISGQQVSGNIDNLGFITVPQQTVQFDPGLGFPLDVVVEGTGQVDIDNTGAMDILYTFEIPLVGSQSTSCNIILNK